MSWDFEIRLDRESSTPDGSCQYAHVNYIAPVGPTRPMARLRCYRNTGRFLCNVFIELHGGTIQLSSDLAFSHLGSKDAFARIDIPWNARFTRATYLKHQDKRYRIFRYGRCDRSNFLVCDCIPTRQNGSSGFPPLIKMEWITEDLLRGKGFRSMDPELSGLIFSLIFAFNSSIYDQVSHAADPLFLRNEPSIPLPAKQDGMLPWHFSVRSHLLYDAEYNEHLIETTVTQTDPGANGRLLAISYSGWPSCAYYLADIILPTHSFSYSMFYDAVIPGPFLEFPCGLDVQPVVTLHRSDIDPRDKDWVKYEGRSYPLISRRRSKTDGGFKYQLLSCDPAYKDGNIYHPVLMEMEKTEDSVFQGCCYSKLDEALYGIFFFLLDIH